MLFISAAAERRADEEAERMRPKFPNSGGSVPDRESTTGHRQITETDVRNPSFAGG
jgi:hypothetical protein